MASLVTPPCKKRRFQQCAIVAARKEIFCHRRDLGFGGNTIDTRGKILVITKTLDPSPAGGRELLCKLNYDVLRSIYREQLVLFEIPAPTVRGVRGGLSALRGHIDGLNLTTINAAIELADSEGITSVFVDGSNLGAFAKALRRRRPNIGITIFFHNVEARFFWDSLRIRKDIHALAVLVANWIAERMAVRHSDKRICLSERDSQTLKRVYGNAATHVSPIALHDRLPKGQHCIEGVSRGEFALFIGGAFYANCAGIKWFVEHVVPSINIKICIVGRGFERLRCDLEREGKVEVVGSVDSVAPWYLNCRFVIAPIFGGSGMKTKVAEALMFGKRIVGTPEAFSGYEDAAIRAGFVCSTASEFVSAIRRITAGSPQIFDHDLRMLFEERYSYSAARSRFARILK